MEGGADALDSASMNRPEDRPADKRLVQGDTQADEAIAEPEQAVYAQTRALHSFDAWVKPGNQRIALMPADGARRVVFEGVPSKSSEPLVESSPDGLRISLYVPGFECTPLVESGVTYEQVAVDRWSVHHEVGEPSVPARELMIPIPDGVEPVVSVDRMTLARVDNIRLAPAQPPYLDVMPEPPRPPFQQDEAIYASAEAFPKSPVMSVRVERMRNRRILCLQLAAACVRPALAEADFVKEMELTVAYERMPDFGEAELDALTPPAEPLPESFSTGEPSIYMILMDDQFTNNTKLAEFVEWKRRKGYDVRTVPTSAIDASGAPTNGQLVAYMRALPAADYPEYLLIIGDHTPANGVEGEYYVTDDGGWSDLSMACRTSSDWLPDLYHGRLPASNNTYLSNMVATLLLTDRDTPTDGVYQKVCVAGQIQDSDDHNDVADRLFCETADLIACYFEQDAGGVDYTCERAIINPDGVTTGCYWHASSLLWKSTDRITTRVYNHFVTEATATARISANINRGVAIVQHRDHGYSGGYGWADPDYQASQINALTNRNRRPLIFSINCASGAYQHDRFLRAWFQNANGGAYAVFAPVDISYSWYNDWLTHGFYAAFLTNYISFQNTCASPNWPKNLGAPGGSYGAVGSAKRLGEILNFGKMYMREKYGGSGSYSEDTFTIFHVFGDPEAYIQLLTPTVLTAQVSSDLAVGVSGSVTVTNLPNGAQVCLFSGPLGVQMVTQAVNKAVVFPVTPASTGVLHVTVSGYAMKPYTNTVSVQGAVVAWADAQLDTDEGVGLLSACAVRAGDLTVTTRVDAAAVQDTALSGSDFAPTNARLTFWPGMTSVTFQVALTDDADDEGYEVFSLILTNAAWGSVGAMDETLVTLEDNDGPGTLAWRDATVSLTEADETHPLIVVRRNGREGALSADFATVDGSAVSALDYGLNAGTVTLPDGATSAVVNVRIRTDDAGESAETFGVNLSPVGGVALASPTQVVVTIQSNAGLAGEPLIDEGFESGVPPYGWSQSYVSGTVSWSNEVGGYYSHPSGAHGGSLNARLYCANSSSDHKTRLITPAIDFTGRMSNPTLTFWHAQALWSPDQDELRVYYRTSAAGAWSLLAEYTADTPSWTERVLALPDVSADYYVAFEGNAVYGYGVCIDDVQVTADSATEPEPMWTLRPLAGAHGAIDPEGCVYVTNTQSGSFAFNPDEYYQVSNVWKNGAALGPILGYAWEDVTGHGTIAVAFAEAVVTNGASALTPQWWLAEYNLTNGGVAFAEAATNDHDGDGLTAWEEYIVGADPTNAGSSFALTGPEARPAGHVVRWNAVAGRAYSLSFTTNLSVPFSTLAENLTIGVYTDTVNESVEPIYYRLRVIKP